MADADGVAVGSALNTLSDGGGGETTPVADADADADGDTDGGTGGTADGAGDGFTPGRAEPCPEAAVGPPDEGAAGAVGICGTVGQAVRLAGAPASTGTGVGRIPQPVASASSSTAPAARRADPPEERDGWKGRHEPALTAHSPRKRRPARAAGSAAASA
ncbi:hypothetical protein ACFVHB_01580 [Kitasatospora sp. NPDC127111]|uniref:hypothetical protein n=1 Tax=Kitasatospora sp. NPDC127111 TaxID=3345363 RepID=UPI00362CFD2B